MLLGFFLIRNLQGSGAISKLRRLGSIKMFRRFYYLLSKSVFLTVRLLCWDREQLRWLVCYISICEHGVNYDQSGNYGGRLRHKIVAFV